MTTNKFIVERTVVPSDNTTLGSSYTDVAGLSWTVFAGQTYQFEAKVVYDVSAATEGCSFSITGPASPTACSFTSVVSSGATPTQSFANAYQLPAAAASDSAFTTDNIATISGVITPSADGVVQVRGIKSGGTATVQGASSVLTWKRVDWPADA